MNSRADAEVSAQLRLFAEQTTDFVGVADPWGRILYLNPAARKRLGVADATELTLADVFPAEAFTLYYEVRRARSCAYRCVERTDPRQRRGRRRGADVRLDECQSRSRR